MHSLKISAVLASLVVMLSMLTSGCALNFYKQSPRSKKQIQELEAKISDLEAQRRKEQEEFEDARNMMEKRLMEEIKGDKISLRLDEAGLAIILSDDILFDSGKADVKKQAYPVLDYLISIINEKVPGKNIGVTGHTDNVPIKFSGWKSNWELAAARATNVLYYLENNGVSPQRLSATGYGEHRPIVSNDTAAGRAKNRRVEIVILPEFTEKREGAEFLEADADVIK
ncbi:MAG: flagellar motor protein MotB [Candidatus Omnitrophota bacterium]